MLPTISSISTIAAIDNQTSVSGAHTVAAGLSNPTMVVMVNSPQFAAANAVNWNGTAMTQLSIGSSSNYWCSAFYLLDPEDGTFNVNVGWAVIEREACITIATIENAGVPVYLGEDNNFTGNPSFSGNTTEDDSLVLEFIMSQVTSHTYGAPQTQHSNFASNVGNYRHSVSSQDVPSAGAVTMGVTFGANKTYQMKVLQLSERVSQDDSAFLNFLPN